MRSKEYKKCPRCDKKVPILQDRCQNCGLIFSRLSKVSNSAAKKAIKAGKHNKVIMMSELPKDVSKKRLLLLSIFLGILGVHFADVGRYKMFAWGIISQVIFLVSCFFPLSWFSDVNLFYLMWGMVFPWAVYFIFYLASIVQIIFNRFKVPVAIDEEYVVSSLNKDLVNDILREVKTKDNIDKDTCKKTDSCLAKREKKIKVVCASCGCFVKVNKDEKICPKCDESLYDD